MICCCRSGGEWEEHRCHCEVVVLAADFARTSVSWLWGKGGIQNMSWFVTLCEHADSGIKKSVVLPVSLLVSLSVIKEYHLKW